MENDNAKFKNEFKKRLYGFVLRLVRFIDRLPKSSVNEVMGKQLLRSGTSVIANYIEANSASSKKDFINFFTHALKSANESKVWLALIKDTNKSDKTENEWLISELKEIANILASSILTMRGKK
ncbi:four helix bundle protein [Candidatus Kuenenbacteria bacterium]|nr:four helix bundle protein [Candidatus Kuenenbacteria bacterium]